MNMHLVWKSSLPVVGQPGCLFLLMVGLLPLNLGAEGTLRFNNLQNTNSSVQARSSGLVFFQGEPLKTDLNFQLTLMIPGTTNETTFKWLLRDGSADEIALGNGFVADPRNEILRIPWADPGESVLGYLAGWNGLEGNYSDASSNGRANGAVTFGVILGDDLSQPSLTAMGALHVGYIPEPSTLTLSALGVGTLLFLSFYRKLRHVSRAPFPRRLGRVS